MAWVDLVATSAAQSLRSNLINKLPFVTKSSAGANVDISAWNAITLLVAPLGIGSDALSFTYDGTGKVVSSSGTSTLTISASDYASTFAKLSLSSYQYSLFGQPVALDDFQQIASGNLSVLLGN